MINEQLWHPEQSSYRGVTGLYANFPDKNGVPTTITMPTKGTVPIAKDKTGTIDSTGVNVRGTGTSFLSQVQPDDFIYNGSSAATQAVRKVTAVISDTLLILEQAFPVDLSGASLLVCERQWCKTIQAYSSGTAAAILQEATFKNGDKIITGGAPVAYDASASNAQISFTVNK